MKAAYGLPTTAQTSTGDINSQNRSRSQAEITGANIMSAVHNYKPLQRINLKGKKKQQNRSPTREIAANAALQEARSSYKLMKITNQMDDDI